MPLHYPRYQKSDYESMPEWKLDCLLKQYGLPVIGDVNQKRKFAMGAFLWPSHVSPVLRRRYDECCCGENHKNYLSEYPMLKLRTQCQYNFNEIDQQKRDDDSSSVVVANDPAFEKKGYGDVMPQLVY
ncbi:hypothetical protein ACFX13_039031 [Malus domestica]